MLRVSVCRTSELHGRGMESGFKVRIKDPLNKELARAKQRIGDLSMENELLHERLKKKGPFQTKRSK